MCQSIYDDLSSSMRRFGRFSAFVGGGMSISASMYSANEMDVASFHSRSRIMVERVKEEDLENGYSERNAFNAFIKNNMQLITKDYLLEFCDHINDISQCFEHHREFAMDVEFVEKLMNKSWFRPEFLKTVNRIRFEENNGKIDAKFLEMQFKHATSDRNVERFMAQSAKMTNKSLNEYKQRSPFFSAINLLDENTKKLFTPESAYTKQYYNYLNEIDQQDINMRH